MLLSVRSSPGASCGRVCATAPTSKSSGRIGRSPGSVTKRVPGFHEVFCKLSFGRGPKSRSRRSGVSPDKPSATPSERLMRGRRPNPAAEAPAFTVFTNSERSSSSERNSWRCAITSSSGIRVLAQWIAPAPIQKRAIAIPIPRPSCCAPVLPMIGMNIDVLLLIKM